MAKQKKYKEKKIRSTKPASKKLFSMRNKVAGALAFAAASWSFVDYNFPITEFGRVDYEARQMMAHFNDAANYRGSAFTGSEARRTIDSIRDAVKAYYRDHSNVDHPLSPYEAFQILMLKAYHESHFMHWPHPLGADPQRDGNYLYYGAFHHSKELWAVNFDRYAPDRPFWTPGHWFIDPQQNDVSVTTRNGALRAEFSSRAARERLYDLRRNTFYTAYVDLGYMMEDVIPRMERQFSREGHPDVDIGPVSLYLEHVAGYRDATDVIRSTFSDAGETAHARDAVAGRTVRNNRGLFAEGDQALAASAVFDRFRDVMDRYENIRAQAYGEGRYIPYYCRPQDCPSRWEATQNYYQRRIVPFFEDITP